MHQSASEGTITLKLYIDYNNIITAWVYLIIIILFSACSQHSLEILHSIMAFHYTYQDVCKFLSVINVMHVQNELHECIIIQCTSVPMSNRDRNYC